MQMNKARSMIPDNSRRDRPTGICRPVLIGLISAMFLSAPLTAGARGETADGSPAERSGTIIMSGSATEDMVRALQGVLSTEQVEQLVRERIDGSKNAINRRRPDEQSTTEFLAAAFVGIGSSVVTAVQELPDMARAAYAGGSQLLRTGSLMGLLLDFVKVGLAIAAGLLALMVIGRLNEKRIGNLLARKPEGLGQTVSILLKRSAIDLAGISGFAIVGYSALHLLFTEPTARSIGWGFIGWLVLLPMGLGAVARFNLAPHRPELRLMHAEDDAAIRMYRDSIGAGVVVGLFGFVLALREQLGLPFDELRVGFWLNAVIYVFFVFGIYRSRHMIAGALIGADDLMGPLSRRIATIWPWIAISIGVISWLVVEAISGVGRQDLVAGGENYLTLFLVGFVPAFDTTLRGTINHLSPPHIGEGAVAERAHLATKRGYLRIGRVIIGAGVILSLAAIWDVDLFNTENTNAGIRFFVGATNGLLVFFAGYLIWEVAGIWINRRLAREHTEAGLDLETDEPGEGGGTGLSRLATVLPVVKLALQSLVVVLTVLIGLDELGFNITPLLAGAGVVGLAIGFGAQTLVRDVVSGVFFLADDAFRIGEYLVIGTTVGTVERISLRSLQLQHHKGPVHTIPYGEIPQVTNNSRDWVIMKLKFTFPFETDANRIKKIFKKIGADMLESDYAQDLIQTFKSQGVYVVDDVGIVIRGKFMARPGRQWIIRKDIYNRVQRALDEAGIQFARKEVRVQIPGLEQNTELSDEQKKAVGAAAAEAADHSSQQQDRNKGM